MTHVGSQNNGFRRVFPLWLRAGLGIMALATLVAVACTSGASSSETAGEVRGRVVEVVERDSIEVETLEVQNAQGKVWTFTTEGFVGTTPAHLREHRLFGQSILVSYVLKDGKSVAVKVAD